MTLKQFLRSLPKDGWFLDINNIRRQVVKNQPDENGNWQWKSCPLTCKEEEKVYMWRICGKNQGIPDHISENIIIAADNTKDCLQVINNNEDVYNTHHSNLIELRRHLLKACGL